MKDIKSAIFDLAPQIACLLISEASNSLNTSKNTSGDDQVPLDILCDELIEKEFSKIGSVNCIISEEKEGICKCNCDGEYIVAYDPLDGSSLVDVNLTVGSIFGIYKKIGNADLQSLQGNNLVAAGYIVFGPRVEIVWTDENGTTFYRMGLDKEFHKVQINILQSKNKIISTGGLQKNWTKKHQEIVSDFLSDGYKLRYAGGMVPDLHSIILKGGGIFSYPSLNGKPTGKLRKLFEVFPFAYIFESLGGKAIDSHGNRILDLNIEDNIHETTSCYIGSIYEIEKIKKIL